MTAISLDLERAFKKNQIYIIAPVNHPVYGIGYVLTLVTRELMTDQCPIIMQMIDSYGNGDDDD